MIGFGYMPKKRKKEKKRTHVEYQFCIVYEKEGGAARSQEMYRELMDREGKASIYCQSHDSDI